MFMKVCKKRFGWLAALVPVIGWGQEIIEHPRNATVCVGKNAVFTSETTGNNTGWFLNGVILQRSPFATQTNHDTTAALNENSINTLTVFYQYCGQFLDR